MTNWQRPSPILVGALFALEMLPLQYFAAFPLISCNLICEPFLASSALLEFFFTTPFSLHLRVFSSTNLQASGLMLRPLIHFDRVLLRAKAELVLFFYMWKSSWPALFVASFSPVHIFGNFVHSHCLTMWRILLEFLRMTLHMQIPHW